MNKRTRVFRGLFIAFISIGYIIFLLIHTYAADTSSTAPYNIILSWTGDTSQTQTVSWMVNGNGEDNSFIKYIKTSSYTGQFDADTIAENGGMPAADMEKPESGESEAIKLDNLQSKYEITLKDLEADTSYTYIVGDGKRGWSQPSTFITGDNEKKEFSFMYLGDAQFSDDMDQDNAEWGRLIENAYERNPELSFAISGGDMVNNGSNLRQWNSILPNASRTFSQIPLMTTVGNHECFNYYKQAFTYFKIMALPENGPSNYKEEFYSFDYGNTHFAVLNSCVFWDDPLLGDYERPVDIVSVSNWIRRDLTQSSAENKIVILHHPAYKIFDDESCDRIFGQWVPIFEEAGVDAVFSGHQHLYTRTYPMYEGQINYEKGITYFTAFSGSKTYASIPVWYMEKEIGYISTYQIIKIKNNGIRVICYNADGKELDKFYRYEGFLDVSPGNWFSPYVSVVIDNNIFQGTDVCTFSPQMSMTRAMMCEVMSRIDNSETAGYHNTFADVPDGRWYTESVSWASSNGIVSGTWTDPVKNYSTFSPSESVTREQMAVFIYNYSKYKGLVSDKDRDITLDYSDSNKISEWARKPAAWCLDKGLMKGREDGTFDPKGTATRAEVAVLTSNYLDFYK